MLSTMALWAAALGQASAAGAPVPAPAATGPCRPGRDSDDIVVCGSPGRSSGDRLPPPSGFDPNGPVDSVPRERRRLIELGAVGTGSCSTVGPGGWTGCQTIRWREADEQHANRDRGRDRGPSVRFGRLDNARR